MTERGFGVTRACGLIGISRSLYRYRSRRGDSAPLRERIEQIASVKRRYGYRGVYLRLRREGWQVNRKRVYRLYREAGLAVRRRKRKRIALFERKPLPKPARANESWSMDVVADETVSSAAVGSAVSPSSMTARANAWPSRSTRLSRGCACKPCSSISPTAVAYRSRSPSTTDPSSTARCSTSGRIDEL
jgi:helix-turn-helix protein